jgi:hypothetical protein
LLDKIEQCSTSTLDLVSKSIEAEYAHAMRAIESLIDKTEETLERRSASAKMRWMRTSRGLRDVEETPRPQKIQEEINALSVCR